MERKYILWSYSGEVVKKECSNSLSRLSMTQNLKNGLGQKNPLFS
jgi:hypothetical protein